MYKKPVEVNFNARGAFWQVVSNHSLKLKTIDYTVEKTDFAICLN